MTINLLTMMVVNVLGKYAVDKGATLLKESGWAAVQAASRLCEFVLTQLKDDPADARNVERFEKNPQGYRVPITDAITDKAKSDPNFAAQLSSLLEEYIKTSRAAEQDGIAIVEKGKRAIRIDNTQSRYSSDRFEP